MEPEHHNSVTVLTKPANQNSRINANHASPTSDTNDANHHNQTNALMQSTRCQVLRTRYYVLGARCQVLRTRYQVPGASTGCQVIGTMYQVLGTMYQVLGTMYYVLHTTSYVLRTTCYVLCATCFVLCTACYVLLRAKPAHDRAVVIQPQGFLGAPLVRGPLIVRLDVLIQHNAHIHKAK